MKVEWRKGMVWESGEGKQGEQVKRRREEEERG